jgi:hypothetical protein
MNYATLISTTYSSCILILSFTEEDLEPARLTDPSSYLYFELGSTDFFGDTPVLGHKLRHEHLIITTAPFHMTLNDLDNIIDHVLELDRKKESVRVLSLLPDIVRKLRSNPSVSHTFELAPPLPAVIVLLGGEERMEQFINESIKFLDD